MLQLENQVRNDQTLPLIENLSTDERARLGLKCGVCAAARSVSKGGKKLSNLDSTTQRA